MSLISPGAQAPAFALAASDGSKASLADFRGKHDVVLVFYCANDTPG